MLDYFQRSEYKDIVKERKAIACGLPKIQDNEQLVNCFDSFIDYSENNNYDRIYSKW